MSNDTITDACCSTRTSAPLEIKHHAPFEAVRITAADYNPRSEVRWDGSPFTSFPDWLRNMLDTGALIPVTPRGTDYAEWQITTNEGTVVGGPDDWIIRDHFGRVRILTDIEATPLSRADQLAALRNKARYLNWDIRHLEKLAWHEERGEPEMGMAWCETCDGKGTVGERESCGSCDGSGEVQAD